MSKQKDLTLGNSANSYYDNGEPYVEPDDINLVDTNNVDVDLTSFGTITGTWNVVVIG